MHKDQLSDAFIESADTFQSVLQMFSLCLIGFIMVFMVGLPLVTFGKMEGLIPLTIGSLALYNLWRRMRERKRMRTKVHRFGR